MAGSFQSPVTSSRTQCLPAVRLHSAMCTSPLTPKPTGFLIQAERKGPGLSGSCLKRREPGKPLCKIGRVSIPSEGQDYTDEFGPEPPVLPRISGDARQFAESVRAAWRRGPLNGSWAAEVTGKGEVPDVQCSEVIAMEVRKNKGETQGNNLYCGGLERGVKKPHTVVRTSFASRTYLWWLLLAGHNLLLVIWFWFWDGRLKKKVIKFRLCISVLHLPVLSFKVVNLMRKDVIYFYSIVVIKMSRSQKKKKKQGTI